MNAGTKPPDAPLCPQLSSKPQRFTRKQQGELARPIVPMWGTELGQLLAILHALQPRRVFEWGSGGSTVTLPRMCPYVRRWSSVEHDPDWYARVGACVAAEPVRVRLCEVSFNFADREMYARSEQLDGNPEWNDYVHAIEDERPDLVLVDGRARNRCLLRAAALAPPCTIVVHDAQRLEYRATLERIGARWLQPYTGGQVAVVKALGGPA
jgi:hypothetical protein